MIAILIQKSKKKISLLNKKNLDKCIKKQRLNFTI